MDNQTLQRIKDILGKNEAIGILVGQEVSLDAMAAALSLSLGLKTMGKSVSVASPLPPTVEISSLVGIDSVKTQLEGNGGDLVVSFPYREGEIEKVSYTIENNYLNIVVKAGQGGLNFSQQDIKYSQGGQAASLLFVVGTPRLSDLGNLFNPDELKDTTIVNIDNSSQNQGFGDIVLVSPQYSSVSEQVADMLLALGVELDIDMSQNLLSGISQATNNFQSPKTSYLAFQMVAELMRRGAKRITPSESLRTDQSQNMSSFMPRPQPQSQPQQPRWPSQLGRRQQPANNPHPEQKTNEPTKQPPSDWLTPKVYKGSTSV